MVTRWLENITEVSRNHASTGVVLKASSNSACLQFSKDHRQRPAQDDRAGIQWRYNPTQAAPPPPAPRLLSHVEAAVHGSRGRVSHHPKRFAPTTFDFEPVERWRPLYCTGMRDHCVQQAAASVRRTVPAILLRGCRILLKPLELLSQCERTKIHFSQRGACSNRSTARCVRLQYNAFTCHAPLVSSRPPPGWRLYLSRCQCPAA